MNCMKIKRLLSRWNDGELLPGEEAELSLHLEQCDTCRNEKIQMLALHRMLTSPDPITPSSQFLISVRRQIATPASWSDYFSPLFERFYPALTGTLFVICFILSLVAGGFMNGNGSSSTPEKEVIVEAFNHTMNISIFNDIPDHSFASAYVEVLKEKKK